MGLLTLLSMFQGHFQGFSNFFQSPSRWQLLLERDSKDFHFLFPAVLLQDPLVNKQCCLFSVLNSSCARASLFCQVVVAALPSVVLSP